MFEPTKRFFFFFLFAKPEKNHTHDIAMRYYENAFVLLGFLPRHNNNTAMMQLHV